MNDLSRRQLLRRSDCGFGSLALAGLLADEAAAEGGDRAKTNPLREPLRLAFALTCGKPALATRITENGIGYFDRSGHSDP